MTAESKLKILFFKNASPDEIYSTIYDYAELDKKEFVLTIDCLLEADLTESQKEKAIQAFEELFLTKNFSFLRKQLFLLYDSLNNESMARYFLDICNEDDPDCLNGYEKIVNRYKDKLLDTVDFSYNKNNFSTSYMYNGIEKSYTIFSFSNEIGNNMTLLKTPYGALIFDCGAKCSIHSTIQITTKDIKDFLFATDTELCDVKGVFISHAHLDHYGSINSFIDLGYNKEKIYVGELTKSLILNSTIDNIKIENSPTTKDFFVANNSIIISPFRNGHILGSEAFLITFDNINILFTGDFCIHDQLTVPGFRYQEVLKLETVKKNGVDCLITETTYGSSIRYLNHDSSIYALIHLTDVLLGLGYKVFFPSFAIGRSQEIASMLNSKFSILLDGLSVKISHIYEELASINIFNENTRYNTEDDRLYNLDCNNVIIASSGMVTEGSTSYKYIKDFLDSDANIAIVKTGFISSESSGNDLLNEWKNKNNILVDIPLSAHASYNEIIELINAISPKNIVTIHGNGLLLHDGNDFVYVDKNSRSNDINSGNLMDNNQVIEESAITNDTSIDEISKVDEEELDLTDSTNNPSVLPNEIENTILIEHREDDLGDAILVDDIIIRSKLENVYKSGASLVKNNVNPNNSQSFVFACKLLIKFLKTQTKYLDIYEILSKESDYSVFYNIVCDCIENGYCFNVKKNKKAEEDIKNDHSAVDESPIFNDEEMESIKKRADRVEKTNGVIQSDVMIVTMENGNYYVSEKIHGREVYYKMLYERAHTSTHYHYIDEARNAAIVLKNKIIGTSPDCQIVEINISDYSKINEDILKDRGSIESYFYDNTGEPVFGISAKGNKVLYFREGEEQYCLIDKKQYEREINDKIALYSNNRDCDYTKLGYENGYLIARDASIPVLRLENYKAKEMLKSFEWDQELFEYDILFYTAYKNAINDAIEIQKKYPLKNKNWNIHIFDNDLSFYLNLDQFVGNSSIGSYKVYLHSMEENTSQILNDNDIILVYIGKDDDTNKIIEQLMLSENQTYELSKTIRKKKSPNAAIETAVAKIFKMGTGSDGNKIEDHLIDTLVEFEDDSEDNEKEDIKSEKNKIKGLNKIKDSLSDDYLRIINTLYSDYNSIKSDDISTLKGMCNRCIRHDQQDWKTTYYYLGKPEIATLKEFADDALRIRDEVRANIYDSIPQFIKKYDSILSLMRENLLNDYYNDDGFASQFEDNNDEEKTIELLDLSQGAYSCLYNAGEIRLSRVCKLEYDDLMSIRGMNPGFAHEIENKVLLYYSAKENEDGGLKKYGLCPIAPRLIEQYSRIIKLLLLDSTKVRKENIDYLKGMCKRSISNGKDSLTTYYYLGQPDKKIVEDFINDSEDVSLKISYSNYDLSSYIEKYRPMLERMLVNIEIGLYYSDEFKKIICNNISKIQTSDDNNVEKDELSPSELNIDNSSECNDMTCFGRIPEHNEIRYKEALGKLFNYPDALTKQDCSWLRSMVRSSIKRDNSFWKTMYYCIGKPNMNVMLSFVADAKDLRDEIAKGKYTGVGMFIKKYNVLLTSAQKNINSDVHNSIDFYKFMAEPIDFFASNSMDYQMPIKQAIIIPSDKLDIDIQNLSLSPRTFNCLNRAKIENVGQIVEMSINDLLKVRNLGKFGIKEILGRLNLLMDDEK